MKIGDIIICPHCGQETAVKAKTLLDGWMLVGKALACAICGARLADMPAEQAGSGEKLRTASDFANLLATEAEARPELKAGDDEKKFCRDCAHFIAHPFLSRCTLHRKTVNPMDDCPDFKPRLREETN